MSPSAGKHVYLVDGSAYLFRAFHALPPMTRADGTPVNAVYGFTNMLLKLIDDAKADGDADYVAIIFDAARTTFRNDIYPDYKANRPPPPDELIPQFALVRDATRALELPCIEMDGYEADDIIATYARIAVEQGAKVTIVSSDKDLMQLVGDGVEMLDPMKSKRIRDPEVREKFGVGPDKVIDVQALAGDSTDNVPGVPGIGVKTAAQLIEEYGDLDTLLARAEEIKQPKRRENLIEHADLARVSRELVTLRKDVPVPEPIEAFELKDPDAEKLLAFLTAQEFKSLVSRVASRLGAAGDATAAAVAEGPATDDLDARLVDEEKDLEAWIALARKRGWVAFDTETTSLDATQAELVGFSLAVEPGRACYVPVGHRHARRAGLGAGGRQAQADRVQARPRPDQVAARRPGGAQDRPQHQVRHGRDAQLRRRHRAGRRHHGAVLRLRRRPQQARPRRAGRAPPGPHQHQVFGGLRQRQGPDLVRRGAARQGLPLCRRGRRRHLAPAPAVQAAAGHRARDHGLRDAGAAADPGAGRYGMPRHQGRRRRAPPAVRRFRAAHGRARGRDLRARRRAIQHRLAQAARRHPVRPHGAGRRQEDQDRRLGHRRRRARDAGGAGPRPARARARLAPALQAQEHLYRRAGQPDQPAHQAGPHQLCDGDRGDRAAVLDRPQPPEHPGAHRRGPAHPRGLRRRQGLEAGLARLFADRAAPARPRRRHGRGSSKPSATGSTSMR